MTRGNSKKRTVTENRLSESTPKPTATQVGGPGRAAFISCGLPSVDDAMRGGFARGSMTMVAGRAQVGATSLLIGAVLHALKQGLKVAWFSDKLNEGQLKGRLILRSSEVNGYRIQAGLMSQEDELALARARETIFWDRLWVDCVPNGQLKRVLSLCRQNPPDLLVVDFPPASHGASGTGLRAYENGVREVAARVKKCGTACVVRQLLPKGLHPPDKMELPGLGSVTEQFEAVAFMHRFTGEEGDDHDASRAFAQIIRVQHRDIRTRSVPLYFDQRFAGLAEMTPA